LTVWKSAKFLFALCEIALHQKTGLSIDDSTILVQYSPNTYPWGKTYVSAAVPFQQRLIPLMLIWSTLYKLRPLDHNQR